MTIDEEIKHQEEISDRYARMSEYEENNGNDGIAKDCAQCAADHRQLAEWLKGYKELEAKHWDECRQIAHYDDELKEAKRLLRLAIDDINTAEACDTCEYYPVINSDMCQKDDCYKWRYADEALKLLEGDTNE